MKIMKESIDSTAAVLAAESYSQIYAGSNSVGVDTEGGTFVNGPLSISSAPHNTKFGGIFRINELVATGMPSTMITPIPMLVIDPPIKNIASMGAIAAMVASVGL